MTDVLQELPVQEDAVKSGDEDVRQYVHEIRRYPLLRPEEERELAIRCARGDEDAIRRMVNSNLRLVVAIAREYAGRGVPLLDLIQEGSIGLIVAARKFDYTLDIPFSAYAGKGIRQRIAKTLTNQTGMIYVPGHTAERIRRLTAEKGIFVSENGREPTIAELALRTDIPEDKVRQLLQLAPEICSLDAPVGEDGEGTVGNLVAGDEDCEPQAVLIRQEMKTILDDLLSRLNPRQQQILRLRFGLEDGECHTLESVSEAVGVSRERVRQIELQAIKRLNKLGAELGLEAFLE